MIKEDNENPEREFDPKAFLSNFQNFPNMPNMPPLPALEALNKHRELLTNPGLLAGLGGPKVPMSAASILGMPPHTTFSPLPPARPPSQPTTPSSQQSSSPIQQNFSSQQNWSFEEQFKQVRE